MHTQLYAGAGYADITPAVGGKLYGYDENTYSTACHDPLEIKALALAGEDSIPVLMLSVSVGDFGTAPCTETRCRIADVVGVPAERIFLSATHTHSAPNVAGTAGWGSVDRFYLETILIPGAVRASEEALAALVPAEFAVSEGVSEVGVNRRWLSEDGIAAFGQNPWGCQDKTMTVIRFRNAETKAGIFQLIHYGCHGTAAGCSHEITRDWSGVMLDRIEAETGIPTGFWNGCVGDIGPRIANGGTTGDIRHVEELGGLAALDAMRIAKPLEKAFYTAAPLRFHMEEVPLPVRPLPSKETVDSYLTAHPRDAHYSNLDGLVHDYMCKAADLYSSGGSIPERRMFSASVVALGGHAAFCFTPYELFSEICLRLRQYSPFPYTLAVSLTNGYEAYLPSRDALICGGYEVDCFRYGDIAALDDNTDTVLIGHFLRILRNL